MTVGKASALAAGFVGALALGVAIGPTVHDRLSKTSTEDTVVTESAPAPTPPAPAARVSKRAVAAAPTPARERRASASEPLVAAGPPGSVQSVASRSGNRTCANACKSVLNPGHEAGTRGGRLQDCGRVRDGRARGAEYERAVHGAQASRPQRRTDAVRRHPRGQARSRREGRSGARAGSGASGSRGLGPRIGPDHCTRI